jgi:phosphatidylserine/phosphatidylglycerophosphate/cardiolipin synthase-like enzyme
MKHQAYPAAHKVENTQGKLSIAVVAVAAALLNLLSGQVTEAQAALQGPISFFYAPAPDAHVPIIQKIQAAQSEINMTMFHMSDPQIVTALTDAAGRGVNIRIIFDKIQYTSPKGNNVVTQLSGAGINVRKATIGFSITHEKAMTIDGAIAMVSTMNEVDNFTDMLDYGIFNQDPDVVTEMNSVFETDWQNAQTGAADTPALSDENLLWSPVNSTSKLVSLIDSATQTLILTVENMGETDVQQALLRAAGRGVQVRTLVPMCDIGTPSFNQAPSQALIEGGVNARMLPGPATADLPYIHAKTIVVDAKMVYLGSENFSFNSLQKARELGIILPNAELAGDLDYFFEKLWVQAQPPPSQAHYNCPAFPSMNNMPGGASDAPAGTALSKILTSFALQVPQH